MGNEIYERIKSLCEKDGTNITALCKKITGSTGNSETWKKGNIRSNSLILISQEFSVSIDYLLTGEEFSATQELSEDNLLLALFDGDKTDITDDMYGKIKAFALELRDEHRKARETQENEADTQG